MECHDFGWALFNLKQGKKVCREGWNGKGMWIVLVRGSGVPVTMNEPSTYRSAGLDRVEIDSHIDMYTAGGAMQPGWLASQSDMLAEDWQIVE